METLNSVVDYCNDLLAIDQFNDYCPNGLQIQGRPEVKRIVGGVTASRELIDAAISANADAILVHHGYFWKGEDPAITGMKYDRVKRLLESGISLIAYHLPLDAHPRYGNNAQLAKSLGLTVDGGFARHGRIDIAQHGHLQKPLAAPAFAQLLADTLGRTPLHIAGHDREINTVGWCTGAAQGYIDEAALLGLDAYISGEVSEHTWHAAKELGIDYFSAGHHATERYGVIALGQHLSEHFAVEFNFIDLPNPV